MPFTVSTKFGIRSARRFMLLSTSAKFDLMFSFFATIWFLLLTYMTPNTSTMSTTTINTIRPLPIAFFSSYADVHATPKVSTQPLVHFIHNAIDGAQVGRKCGFRVDLALAQLAFAQVEDLVK